MKSCETWLHAALVFVWVCVWQQFLSINACSRDSFWCPSPSPPTPCLHVAHLIFISSSPWVSCGISKSSFFHFLVPHIRSGYDHFSHSAHILIIKPLFNESTYNFYVTHKNLSHSSTLKHEQKKEIEHPCDFLLVDVHNLVSMLVLLYHLRTTSNELKPLNRNFLISRFDLR